MRAEPHISLCDCLFLSLVYTTALLTFFCLSLVLLYSYFQFSFRFSYIFLVTSFAVYGVHALLRICFVLIVEQKALQCRHQSVDIKEAIYIWKLPNLNRDEGRYISHLYDNLLGASACTKRGRGSKDYRSWHSTITTLQ